MLGLSALCMGGGDNAVKTELGRLEDDVLRICFRNSEAKNRPLDYSTQAEANLVLFVMKRRKG
jgi:hypothetical protein